MSTRLEPMQAFQVQVYVPLEWAGMDVSITNTTLWMGVAAVLFVLTGMVSMQRAAVVPTRMQLLFEELYLFVRRLTLLNIHGSGERYVPLTFALFCFILCCNLVGLVPGAFTPTSQIVVTASLAIGVFLYSVGLRVYLHGMGFFYAFVPPGTPKLLLPLMVPIEVLSFLARPVSLAVRLFANMTAGHTVLGAIAFFGFVAPWFVVWIPAGLSVVMLVAEVLISVIQAYIFTVLSCVYIDDAVNAHA
ncbi:MAG TPA: F0F1 ATP synthase subunit A [Mariprofundaceae bacterium]|nr:F0F1 ATP synthase subunit A [Mariprofundaceae bacterium]